MRYLALIGLLVWVLPSPTSAGFTEARNVIGVHYQTLSGPMKAFYTDVTSQTGTEDGPSSSDKGYPIGAFGLSFRSFGTDRVGAELTFSYASKKRWEDGLSLSTLGIYLGPVFSIPIVGEREYVIPFGCAGVAMVRSAVDINSQLDIGLYFKLGIQGIIVDQIGVTASVVYTRVTAKYDGSKGLGKANIIDESYPVGDGSLILEFNYLP